MQRIVDWLKVLGMAEYAERFAENGIDVSVFRHLTDQDLKDIGVLLGHRRKMLAAIAERAVSAPVKPQHTGPPHFGSIADRIDPAGLPRPRRDLWRAASWPFAQFLPRIITTRVVGIYR
jgi:hypothetical protein